jgi:Low affinity iron permease
MISCQASDQPNSGPVTTDISRVRATMNVDAFPDAIQNTQNRDTEALHLKLDELIHATKGARYSALELEDKSEEQLDAVEAELLKKPQIRRGWRAKEYQQNHHGS